MKLNKAGINRSQTLRNFVLALPVSLPAGLAASSVVLVMLLLVDSLTNVLILLAVMPVFFTVLFFSSRQYANTTTVNDNKALIATVVALVFVSGWGFFNARLSSQHVFTNRDPGIYAITSVWLSEQSSVRVNAPEQYTAIKSVTGASSGMYQSIYNKNEINPHGNHLLPGLLGVGGRVVGALHSLKLAAFIGALALLAVFGFARTMMRPFWALLSMALLSISMPMLYFSRDTYTEPLTMVFVFGGLSMASIAYKSSSKLTWALFGMTVAASTLARIDAWLIVAGFLGSISVWVVTATHNEQRARISLAALWVAVVAFVGLVSWLDLTKLSSIYYTSHRELILQELALIGLITFGVAVAVLLGNKTEPLRKIYQRHQHILAKAAVGLVGISAILIASRPLWFEGHWNRSFALVGGLQAAAGLAVEPMRTYSEITGNWLVWYMGLSTVLFGVIGLGIVAYKAIARNKDSMLYVSVLSVGAATTLVYLVQPSIVPDQIWAIRRFLPVTLPVISLLAIYAVARISAKWSKHAFVGVLCGIAVLTMFVSTAQQSHTILSRRDTLQAAPVVSLCEKLDRTRDVVIWLGQGGNTGLQPVAAICGVRTVRVDAEVSNTVKIKKALDKAKETATAAGDDVVVLTLGTDAEVLLNTGIITKVNAFWPHEWIELERTLVRPPRAMVAQTNSIVMSEL